MTLGLIAIDILLRFVTIEPDVAKRWKQSDLSTDSAENESRESPDKATTEAEETISKHGPVYAEVEKDLHPPGTHQAASVSEDLRASSQQRPRIRLPAVLTLLSSRRLLSALWGTTIQGAIFSGLETVLPLQTEEVFGWDSLGAGLVFLPSTLTAFLGPVVGWFCDKYGPRWPTLAGFLLLCPLLTLLRLVDHNTLNQKVLLCALLTFIGCCFSATLDPLMAEVAYVVERKTKDDPETYGSANKAYAQAFALFNMAWSVGNTVGPLLAGLIRDAAGWGTMTWTLGLLGGVTAISTGLWCGGWILKQDARWSTKEESIPAGQLPP